MYLIDKMTAVKEVERDGNISREVFIAGESGELDNNLFDFCNAKCKKQCDMSWDIEDGLGGFECEDCSVAYMYLNTIKLCHMEHSEEGQAWEKREKEKFSK